MPEKGLGGIQEKISGEKPGARYRRMAVGEDRFLPFLRYELTTSLLGDLGGAVGRSLRRAFYPGMFESFGKGVSFGRGVVLRRPDSVSIGGDVRIGDRAALDVKADDARILIADEVTIGPGTILSCIGGRMVIGQGTVIGAGCRLGSMMGLDIGQGVVIEPGVCISGAAHAYDRLDIPIIMQPLTCRGPDLLGDEVRVGAGATILDGVTVGAGAVIAPGAMVNEDVPSQAVMEGVPARPVEQDRVRDLR